MGEVEINPKYYIWNWTLYGHESVWLCILYYIIYCLCWQSRPNVKCWYGGKFKSSLLNFDMIWPVHTCCDEGVWCLNSPPPSQHTPHRPTKRRVSHIKSRLWRLPVRVTLNSFRFYIYNWECYKTATHFIKIVLGYINLKWFDSDSVFIMPPILHLHKLNIQVRAVFTQTTNRIHWINIL